MMNEEPTLIFGLFGIAIGEDLTPTFSPHLPKGVSWMSLKGLHIAGKRYDHRVPIPISQGVISAGRNAP